MNKFFEGFEKAGEANSLIGTVPNALSGMRKYQKGGVVKPPKAIRPGTFVAPKSDMPPLATYEPHASRRNLTPSLTTRKQMKSVLE